MSRQSRWIVCASCGKEAYAGKASLVCDPCDKPGKITWTISPYKVPPRVDELELAVQQMRGTVPPGAIVRVLPMLPPVPKLYVQVRLLMDPRCLILMPTRAPIPCGALVCMDHDGFAVPTYCHPNGMSVGRSEGMVD